MKGNLLGDQRRVLRRNHLASPWGEVRDGFAETSEGLMSHKQYTKGQKRYKHLSGGKFAVMVSHCLSCTLFY